MQSVIQLDHLPLLERQEIPEREPRAFETNFQFDFGVFEETRVSLDFSLGCEILRNDLREGSGGRRSKERYWNRNFKPAKLACDLHFKRYAKIRPGGLRASHQVRIAPHGFDHKLNRLNNLPALTEGAQDCPADLFEKAPFDFCQFTRSRKRRTGATEKQIQK